MATYGKNNFNWKGGVTKNQKCNHCKKIFDADKSNRKFCSMDCKVNSQKGKEPEWLKNRRGRKPRTYHLRHRDKHGNAFDREWRKKVFERDNFTCQICFKKGGKLQADHIKPYKEFPELRIDLSNGRTLCIDCHKKTETYGWSKYWHTKMAVKRRTRSNRCFEAVEAGK